MTNFMAEELNEARIKLNEMQQTFTAMKKVAIKEAVAEMVNTGKGMTRRDIANMTGLTVSEVERYIEDHIWNAYYNQTGELIANKEYVCRKYVVLNEDGSVDMNTTACVPIRMWVYRGRPGCKVSSEQEPSYEKIFADILSEF